MVSSRRFWPLNRLAKKRLIGRRLQPSWPLALAILRLCLFSERKGQNCTSIAVAIIRGGLFRMLLDILMEGGGGWGVSRCVARLP
jgi:hypothetical protein